MRQEFLYGVLPVLETRIKLQKYSGLTFLFPGSRVFCRLDCTIFQAGGLFASTRGGCMSLILEFWMIDFCGVVTAKSLDRCVVLLFYTSTSIEPAKQAEGGRMLRAFQFAPCENAAQFIYLLPKTRSAACAPGYPIYYPFSTRVILKPPLILTRPSPSMWVSVYP